MYSVIIVAAGSSQRAGLGYNKIFYKINDKTLLEYTIDNFIKDSDFKEIVIVLSKNDLSQVKSLFTNERIKYVIGGSTRQKSVFNGLNLINSKYVFIHDGARPNISKSEIAKLKQVSRNTDAVVLYSKVNDSVVKYGEDKIIEYLDRSEIGLIQTPQVFRSDLIKQAHSLALHNGNNYTDDASLYMKELNKKVTLIEGQDLNIKATTIYDLTLLEDLL